MRETDCNLAVWERHVPGKFTGLLSSDPKDIRFNAPLLHLREHLEKCLDDAGYIDQFERDELAADILMLAERYCSILKLTELEVRLEIVTTNSCRKWHADFVEARLITTYAGSGTQWLTHADAARVKNGTEPLRINAMSAGDVGIFKGKLGTNSPVIHRSPPIDGTGEKRLLLVLNPLEDG